VFNKSIEADRIPEWLKARVTFLIPKSITENPKHYRPVTGLPSICRLLISIISRRMQKYMDDENGRQKEKKKVAAEEQNDVKTSC
jgi:hypothetical protein